MKAGDIVYEVEIETGKLTRGEREATASLDKMGKGMKSTERSAGDLNMGMTKLATAIGGVIAATALFSEFKKAISVTRDFNATISELSALTGSTGEQLNFLRETALEFGRTTTLSASQAATALKLVAGAKPDLLQSADALKAVTREAITLAEAAGIDLPQAAAALTTTLNQFQLGAEQSSRVINVLAAGAKEGAAEIGATVAVLGEAGVVAAQAGLSIEDLTGATQALAKGAIVGTKAGTGLRNILTILNTSADKELRPSLVGLNQALENLAAKGLDDTEMLKLFGRETLTAASTLIQFRGEAARVTEAVTGTNEAYRQAAAVTDNLLGDTKSLGSAYEALQLEIGSLADNTLRDLVQMLTKVTQSVASNRDLLESAFTVVGVAAQSAAAIIAGKVVMAMLLYTKSVYDNVKAQLLAAPATTAAGIAAGGTVAPLTAARLAMNTATLAANGLRTAFAFLGGPAGVLFLVGTAIYQYTQRAKDAKPPTDTLTAAIHQMSTAGERSAKMFAGLIKNIDNLNKQELEIRTEKVEANLKRAEQNLKRYTRMFESGHKTITSGAIEQQEAHIVELNRQLEILRARQSKGAAADAPRTETEEGQKLISSLRDQIELAKLTGEAKARLKVIQDLGADATKEEREEAQKLVTELYRLDQAQIAAKASTEAGAKALADTARSMEANTAALETMEERLRQSSMSARDLALRQAELTLNDYATPEQIEQIRALAGELHTAQQEAAELERRKGAFGTDVNMSITGSVSPLSGGMFDDQVARYEAEAVAEQQRYTEALERLQEAKDLELEVRGGYMALEEQMAQEHAGRMEQIDNARQQVMLQSVEGAFGAVADVMKTAFGEQSALYKTAFVAQKAAAIAQSIIAIQQGIAMAAANPWPLNIGAMASVAAATAGIVSNIAGTNIGARQHGGPVSAGSMYRVNEGGAPEIFNAANGSQYMMPTQRGEVVSNRDATGGSGNNVVVNINNAPPGSSAEASEGPNGEQFIDVWIADFVSDGRTAGAVQNKFGLAAQGR